MHLALGRPRADRAPGDHVGEILRRDHVEVFGSGGQVELVDLHENPPGEPQPLVDPVAVVQMRIVDQPFPADGRARFLEIDAHHDNEVGGELALLRRKPRGVVDRGVVVVNGARADHDQQPVVGAMQDAMDRLPGFEGGGGGSFGGRKLPQQVRRRRELHDLADPGIVDRQPGGRMGQRGSPVAVGGGRGHDVAPSGFSQQKHDFTDSASGHPALCHAQCCIALGQIETSAAWSVVEIVASRV